MSESTQTDESVAAIDSRHRGAWTAEDCEYAFVDLRDAVTAQDAVRVLSDTASSEGWMPLCITCTGLPKLAWWRPDDSDVPDPEVSFFCRGDDYRRRGRTWLFNCLAYSDECEVTHAR